MSIQNLQEKSQFVVIQKYMITDYGLKGNELLIYAIINGFSNAPEQRFTGSLDYLSEWTNSTKQGVLKCLKSLIEKGLLIKEKSENGKIAYSVTGKQSLIDDETKFNRPLNKVESPVKQSLINNIDHNINNNIYIYIKKEIKEKKYGDELEKAVNEWFSYKRERKQTYTQIGAKGFLKKIDNLVEQGGTQYACDCIAESISNNYQGVFPLKKQNRVKQQAVGYSAEDNDPVFREG